MPVCMVNCKDNAHTEDMLCCYRCKDHSRLQTELLLYNSNSVITPVGVI